MFPFTQLRAGYVMLKSDLASFEFFEFKIDEYTCIFVH